MLNKFSEKRKSWFFFLFGSAVVHYLRLYCTLARLSDPLLHVSGLVLPGIKHTVPLPVFVKQCSWFDLRSASPPYGVHKITCVKCSKCANW